MGHGVKGWLLFPLVVASFVNVKKLFCFCCFFLFNSGGFWSPPLVPPLTERRRAPRKMFRYVRTDAWVNGYVGKTTLGGVDPRPTGSTPYVFRCIAGVFCFVLFPCRAECLASPLFLVARDIEPLLSLGLI